MLSPFFAEIQSCCTLGAKFLLSPDRFAKTGGYSRLHAVVIESLQRYALPRVKLKSVRLGYF